MENTTTAVTFGYKDIIIEGVFWYTARINVVMEKPYKGLKASTGLFVRVNPTDLKRQKDIAVELLQNLYDDYNYLIVRKQEVKDFIDEYNNRRRKIEEKFQEVSEHRKIEKAFLKTLYKAGLLPQSKYQTALKQLAYDVEQIQCQLHSLFSDMLCEKEMEEFDIDMMMYIASDVDE